MRKALRQQSDAFDDLFLEASLLHDNREAVEWCQNLSHLEQSVNCVTKPVFKSLLGLIVFPELGSSDEESLVMLVKRTRAKCIDRVEEMQITCLVAEGEVSFNV